MGFRFRKVIKIAPWVTLNITANGLSSVSIGGKGVTLNLGKKGAHATVSALGTGLSYGQKLDDSATQD